jgi:hypothetical protein
MSPVSEPKTLVGLGRWKSVEATLKSVDQLGKTPLPVSLRELLQTEVIQKGLREQELAKLVKLDSSVDVAVALDPASKEDSPEFFVAFSLPLKSMEQAVAVVSRAGSASMVRPGVYRLGKQPSDLTCNLSVSVGDAPARLVCAPRDRDLEALVPWLTRGMPTATVGAGDMHFEARLSPMRERYRALIDQFGPRLPALAATEISRKTDVREPVVLDAVSELVREGLQAGEEIDVVSMDGKIDGATGQASFQGAVKFHGNKSWMVRALTSNNAKAGPPPAIFWQAPKDSGAVAFGLATDPKLLEGVRKSAADVFGALTKGKLPDGDRKAVTDVIAHIPLADGAIMSATGHPDPGEVKPLKGDMTPADAVRMARETVTAAVGWTVVGVDAKSDAYVAWLKDVVKAYNSPSLQKLAKEQIGKHRPLPTVKATRAPKGLPAGATAIEMSVPIDSHDVWDQYRRAAQYKEHPKGAPAKGAVSLTLVVVPDGDGRTWIGVSADPAMIASHIAAAKNGAPKDGTIASRDDLEPLRSGKVVAAGFMSLGGLASTARGSLRHQMRRRDAEQMGKVLSSLPHKGATPILFMASGDAGAAPTAMTEVRVQKGTFEDLQTLVMQVMTMKQSRGSSEDVEPATVEAPAPAGMKKKR